MPSNWVDHVAKIPVDQITKDYWWTIYFLELGLEDPSWDDRMLRKPMRFTFWRNCTATVQNKDNWRLKLRKTPTLYSPTEEEEEKLQILWEKYVGRITSILSLVWCVGFSVKEFISLSSGHIETDINWICFFSSICYIQISVLYIFQI